MDDLFQIGERLISRDEVEIIEVEDNFTIIATRDKGSFYLNRVKAVEFASWYFALDNRKQFMDNGR